MQDLSMVCGRLFKDIDARLREIFSCNKPFAGKSILLCGDLYQLQPVNDRAIFKVDCSTFLGYELWQTFQLPQ